MKRQQKDDIEKLGNEQGEIPDHLKKRKIVQINPQYEDIENAVLKRLSWRRGVCHTAVRRDYSVASTTYKINMNYVV